MNRVGLPILVSAAQLGAAALALGRPDPAPALRFLGGSWPTAGDTLAALGLLVWTIVLAAVGWSLASMGRELASRMASSRRFREGSALATGLLILAAGAAHHWTEPVGMSGGSVEEAQAYLGR
jgi:hypothetical protein